MIYSFNLSDFERGKFTAADGLRRLGRVVDGASFESLATEAK